MASFGAAPKCCKCEKTAYSQESISYDGATYHKRCFRCSKCEHVVSLGKVAMIQGDLYCKNCYLRMFSEKGTYHVFGAKTLPKSMRKSTGTDSPRDQSGSVDETASPSATSPVPNARSSSVPDKSEVKDAPRLHVTTAKPKTCMVDDCQNPRAVGKSYCDSHVEQKAHEKDTQSKPAVSALLDAIKAKSVNVIRELLHQHGPGICLEQHNRKSILQIAFVDEASVSCGEAMVETLADYLKDLEADVAMLKDEMPDKPASPDAGAAAAPGDVPAAAADAPAAIVDSAN